MGTVVVLIIISLGLAMSVFAGVRHARRSPRRFRIEELRALADLNGWSCSQPSGGDDVYVLTDGVWTLRAKFFRGANRASQKSNHQTEWSAPYARDGVILIGPRLPGFVANMDIGSDQFQRALSPLLGDDASMLRGTQRFGDIGNRMFTSTFDVYASDHGAAQRLIGDGIPWTDLHRTLGSAPIVLVGSGRARIIVHDHVRTIDQIHEIISAGSQIIGPA